MLRWLNPGLGIKRWIFLIGFSSLLLGIGAAAFLHLFFPNLLTNHAFWMAGALLGMLGLISGIIGIVLTVGSRTNKSPHSLYRTLKRHSELERGPSIVAIGGGTGLSTLLRGFKTISTNLTAIVAVTDDGGSSGRLRRAYDLPAPGDLRNCLVALAPAEERLSELVSYRFSNGEDLEGHSLGNLLLTALSDINGGFAEAIRECSEVLAVEGRVLPSMLGAPELEAEVEGNKTIVGETDIADSEGNPQSLRLRGDSVQSNSEAIAAVLEADCVVVGPGSLYTSILTNFLEPKLCQAISRTDAPVVYVTNLMTEAGETEKYSVGDHLEQFREIPPQPIEFDHVIINTRQAPRNLLNHYEEEGAKQVVFDYDRVKEYNCEIHTGNYMSIGEHLRHNIDAITKEIRTIINRTSDPGS